MIILEKVRWKNLLSTGHDWTEIDLTAAQNTLICGHNGAGKSTILDALAFGLFNRPYRDIKKPQLINHITNKGLEVEVEFRTETGRYVVKRGMKPNFFHVYANGQLIDQDADSRDFQKELETKILKIDFKTFCQKVGVGSANFTPFMQLQAAERRKIIEDILDIQVFSHMNILLKEEIRKNKDALSQIDLEIATFSRTIDIYKKYNAQINQDNQTLIQEKLDQIEELEDQIAQHIQIVDNLTAKQEKGNKALEKADAVSKAIVKLNKQIIEEDVKFRKQSEMYTFYQSNDSCPTCHQTIGDNIKVNLQKPKKPDIIQELKEKEAKLVEENKKFETINQALNKIVQELSKHNWEIKRCNQEIQKIKTEIETLRNKNDKLKDYSVEEAKLTEAEKIKNQLLDEKEVQTVALTLLKDDGIKANIIKQYIPVINKLINSFLDQMDFFCKFEVDENFKETIKARHRDESSYESFSEGEKMRIDLALLFTWREVARMRNSSSVNILILDEVMDSSLDAAGTEEFLKIIRQLTKNNNVFVISHKTDQISDKFERVIEFEVGNNFSRTKE